MHLYTTISNGIAVGVLCPLHLGALVVEMTEEGVAIDDLDGMLSELAIDGIEPIWSKNYTEYSTRFAYLNTGKIAGLIFELIERKKPEAEKK